MQIIDTIFKAGNEESERFCPRSGQKQDNHKAVETRNRFCTKFCVFWMGSAAPETREDFDNFTSLRQVL